MSVNLSKEAMFSKECKNRISALINLTGVFLIHLPSRPLLYLGNIAVYVPSYTTQHHSHVMSTVTASISTETPLPSLATSTTNGIETKMTMVDLAITTTQTTTGYRSNATSGTSNVSKSSPTLLSSTRTQHRGVQQSWYTPVFSLSWMLGTFLCGLVSNSHVANAFTARLVIGLGIIFQSGSFFVGYYTIRLPNVSESQFLVTLIIGLGFGAGLYEGILLKRYVADRVSPKSLEVVTSIVFSSSAVGGVIINQLITFLTNPDNLSPDLKEGKFMIFSQKEIRQRIPSMFLTLGIIMLLSTMLGYFMLRESCDIADLIEKSNDQESPHDEYFSINGGQKNKTKLTIIRDDENETGGYKSFENTSVETMPTRRIEDRVLNENKTEDAIPASRSGMKHQNIPSNESVTPFNEKQPILTCVDDKSVSLATLEMCKRVTFYMVGFVYMCGSSGRLFLNLYYKIYGQVWINDDHFLTNLGTTMSFLSIFASVIWGVVLQRIGITHCFVFLYSGISMLFLSMYFLAQFDRWAYFILTLINSGFVNYVYPIFTITVLKWFGKNNLSTKLGMIEFFSLTGYILATFVLDALMNRFGFFSGFAWTSAMHIAGLLVITRTFPKQ